DQSFVQVLRTVCRDDHDNSLAAFEPIHSGEQGVDGLLVLAMSIKLAVLSDTIDLINENDCGLPFGRSAKKLANTLRSDANKDLGKSTAMRAKETGLRLAGNRFGQHGFAGSWRTDQQHTFGQIPADPLIFFWIAQKVHHLLYF